MISMKLSDILGMSVTNLWRRKMRTILTVLGVLIGTTSIVVMLSLGLGLEAAMMKSVESSGGLKEITVYSDMWGGETEDRTLTDDLVEQIMDMDYVKNVEPQIAFSLPIQTGKYESRIMVVGVPQETLEEMELLEGELPQNDGMLSLLGSEYVLQDFYEIGTGIYPFYDNDEMPEVDLINTPVVAGINHEMIEEDTTEEEEYDTGYVDPLFSDDEDEEDLEEDNPFAFGEDDFSLEDDLSTDSFSSDDDTYYDEFSEDMMYYSEFNSETKRVQIKFTGIRNTGELDDGSYYCYTTLDNVRAFFKQNYSLNEVLPDQPTDKDGKPYRDLRYTELTVEVDEADNVEAVQQELADMGYETYANKAWIEETQKYFVIIEAVLGGIGAISLLVAAIGIANTMTMSTYERTKEIGVMKVLGCGLGNIRSMFLTEAAFIGFIGGMAGVGLSYLLSFLTNKFLSPMMMESLMYESIDMNISVIPLWLVGAALLFSTLIGMIAGFFPAQRATKLSPLAAIRNE